MFCAGCKNAVRRAKPGDARIDLHDTSGYLQDVSCSNFAKFDPMTDEDFWQSHDTLVAKRPTLGKTAFENLEQTMGFTLNEAGPPGKPSAIPSIRLQPSCPHGISHNSWREGRTTKAQARQTCSVTDCAKARAHTFLARSVFISCAHVWRAWGITLHV